MSDSAPVVSTIVAAPANLLAPDLPAALETGFPAVDAEHRQLLACMRTLRGLCDGLYTRNDCSGCSVGDVIEAFLNENLHWLAFNTVKLLTDQRFLNAAN